VGGKLDGAFGVIAGLEPIAALNDAGVETLRPIEVVSRTNEEGRRFGPGAMGSTACQDATGSSRQKCFVLLEGDSRR
jgi:N-carbamoyl-L-amino-acid hydrolase